MAQFYNVVFAGEVAKGADPDTAKANIARLFKASDAMLARLFSGERVVVKKAVDQATAMKYRAVMKQAGVIAQLVEVDEQGRPLAPAAEPQATPAAPRPAPVVPAAPVAAAAPRPAQTMAERLAQMAAQPEAKPAASSAPPPADDANAGSWKLHPAGAQLGQLPDARPPVALPDLSHITVARTGTDLISASERQALAEAPVVVDTSGISVARPGGDLLKPEEKRPFEEAKIDLSGISMAPPGTEVLKEDERRVVVPVVVDLSGLSVAPPGAPLEQLREEKPPVDPDISHIKLA